MLVPSKESQSAELKRYVRFTAADGAAIARVKSRLAPRFAELATAFYERIREHEAAHEVLQGEEQIARLQRSFVAWLDRLFGGVYDDAYFAKTEQIGRTHVRVGLPPRYVFAAMALVRSSLLGLLDGDGDGPVRDALGRLLDLELATMVEAHHDHLLERVEKASHLRDEAQRRRATSFEENAALAVEAAPVLVVATDAAGAITLFNRAAERLTGYAQDEILGRDFAAVLLPEHVRAPIDRFDADVELPLATRAGKMRMVRWRMARAEGITFAFGVDVTEDASARERDQQERRLAALGTLMTGLAHELRNPLNGAQLHAAFLERALAGGTPEMHDAVRVVKTEIQRLARLVDEFLEFAQPRPLALAVVDVRALAQRVVADAKSVRLDLPLTEVSLEADAGRLEQALRSLVANAVEAGARDVVLRVRREPRWVRFEVEDDGPGLDPRAPVFDAFYTTKADGTGLGLAIVHRTATDHGGTVDVDSRPGCTLFRLRLPCTLEGTRA